MATRMLECGVCRQRYDSTTRLPKVLPECSHTYCLACLNSLSQGRIVCPECGSITYIAPNTMQTCRKLLQLLEFTSLRCKLHETQAQAFCYSHCVPVCAQCYHNECQLAQLEESLGEIEYFVKERVKSVDAYLVAKGVLLPHDLRRKIQDVFNNALQENVDILQRLTALTTKLSCEKCLALEQVFLHVESIRVFCGSCYNACGATGRYYAMSDETAASQVLAQMLKSLLSQVNFCDLNVEILQSVAQWRQYLLPEQLKLAQIVQLYITPRKGIEHLPVSFYCPKCLQMLDLYIATIRILPCRNALHAICDGCAGLLRGQNVVCPLDWEEYATSAETLTWFNYAYYTQASQPVANFETSKIQPGAQSVRTTKSAKFPGTDLPTFEQQRNLYVLDRFPSVLPAVDMPESQYTLDNRGWNVHFDKNQVEAMTFHCTSSVLLTGLGVANPVKAGVTALLRFVKIYSGPAATNAPVVQINPNLQLIGGHNVVTYYALPVPFRVIANEKYTIKLKICAGPSQTEQLMLYRGNPFERPDTWIGSDGALWSFEETLQLDEGETANGQNNYTGPILRFLYTR